MYPFGSGMPQPTPPQNNNMQSNAPFGAGWTMPTQNQIPAQNAYPPNSNQYPQYPPQQHSNYPQHMPNMIPQTTQQQFQHHPYPQQPQYATQQYSNYPQQQHQPTYPPTHSYYPPSTPSQHHLPHSSYPAHQGYPNQTAAASNMAQCFNEMKNHHHSPSASQVVKKEGTPTVVPSPNFDPVKDAHDLRKAMKGFGTDEDTLINIICRRSNEQRQEIQRQYKTHFGKDLIEDIKSETSGNFEKLLVGLLLPIVDFYCTEIYSAMAGIGTDEDVLIEILCTLSNIEIHTIKNAYLGMYGEHLESELKSETSGNFKRLLVSLCTAARDESGYADPVQAQNDARELLKAGELRVGTDESTFNMILCQRNYQQLKLIFQEYEKMTGHSLEKAIKKEFSGDIMDGLLAIYKCVTDKTEYFATRLHKSMAGFGTNDSQLIRVIITRCEIDMQDIKSTFERLYGKSLKSWVKGDTSGHYKHALYALIGEQRSS